MHEYDLDFLFDILSFSPPVGVFFVYGIFFNVLTINYQTSRQELWEQCNFL